MGSVNSYVTASGKRYRVRFRRPDGTQTDRRGFKTKRDAELFLSTVEISKAKGEFIDVAAATVRVSELGSAWIRDRQQVMKPSTFRSLESAWRIHVEPKWGRRPVSDLRHSDIQAWVSKMAISQSATNVLRSHGVLAGILDAAVRDRRISANPARGVLLPRKGTKPKAYLSHPQVELLAQVARESTMVRFLAYTGLRWGEAAGLRVRNCDLARRRVLVVDNAVMVGTTVVVGTPKSHKSRSVPIPAFLNSELERVTRGKPDTAYLFGTGEAPVRLPNSKDGWFASAVRRAQKIDATFPRVTPHDLRHSAASLAVSAGANVKAVQRMLGHASAAMTLDVYSDLFDDDLDAVADRLDRARSDSNVGKMWAEGPSGE